MTLKSDIKRGLDLLNGDDLEGAEAAFKGVLKDSPGHAGALQYLGQMAQRASNWDVAEKLYLRSLEADPDQAEVWTNFGALLNDQRRVDAAEAALNNALQLSPDYAPAYKWQGAIALMKGETARGLALLKKAQGLNPKLVSVYPALAKNKAIKPDDGMVATMNTLLDDPVMEPGDLAALHYALAYVYEAAGDTEQFFEHLEAANQHQRSLTGEWRSEFEAGITGLNDRMTPEFLAQKTSPDQKQFTPIFIVGLPRSGSTLVEQILASHTDVFGGDELPYFLKFLSKVVGQKTGKVLPEGLERLTAEDFSALANHYQNRVGKLQPGSRYITDKMPWNFQMLGPISCALPWAKVIHIERDAFDCGYSTYKNALADSFPYCCDFDDYAFYRQFYQKQMAVWREKLPGFILDVRYEELVADPEAQIRRNADFCGLGWQPAMLDFHKTRREVRTLSQGQVTSPITAASIGAAKKHAKYLKPLKVALEKYQN